MEVETESSEPKNNEQRVMADPKRHGKRPLSEEVAMGTSGEGMAVKKIEGEVCGVCKHESGKYRCAKCRSCRYCSVACYKEHQLACGVAHEGTKKVQLESRTQSEEKNGDEQKQQLGREALLKVIDDSRVRIALKSRYLQDSILYVDSAPTEQRKARLEQLLNSDPLFADFVDYLLKLLGRDRDKDHSADLDDPEQFIRKLYGATVAANTSDSLSLNSNNNNQT